MNLLFYDVEPKLKFWDDYDETILLAVCDIWGLKVQESTSDSIFSYNYAFFFCLISSPFYNSKSKCFELLWFYWFLSFFKTLSANFTVF